MISRKMKVILASSAWVIAVLAGLGAVWLHHLGKVHQHCIKITGLAFRMYAGDHNGAFPYHTNGFGDALLLLVKEHQVDRVAYICGPGDDGHVLTNALAQGLDVQEDQCSRVYVQGLTETNNPEICILFDRRSVKGGDHFYGSGKPVREVCMLDGSMETISDERWPEFSRHQVELLIATGFKREKALEYYPAATPDK
jgi:hypothetical protein